MRHRTRVSWPRRVCVPTALRLFGAVAAPRRRRRSRRAYLFLASVDGGLARCTAAGCAGVHQGRSAGSPSVRPRPCGGAGAPRPGRRLTSKRPRQATCSAPLFRRIRFCSLSGRVSAAMGGRPPAPPTSAKVTAPSAVGGTGAGIRSATIMDVALRLGQELGRLHLDQTRHRAGTRHGPASVYSRCLHRHSRDHQLDPAVGTTSTKPREARASLASRRHFWNARQQHGVSSVASSR